MLHSLCQFLSHFLTRFWHFDLESMETALFGPGQTPSSTQPRECLLSKEFRATVTTYQTLHISFLFAVIGTAFLLYSTVISSFCCVYTLARCLVSFFVLGCNGGFRAEALFVQACRYLSRRLFSILSGSEKCGLCTCSVLVQERFINL